MQQIFIEIEAGTLAAARAKSKEELHVGGATGKKNGRDLRRIRWKT
jgi:hypothetical protein